MSDGRQGDQVKQQAEHDRSVIDHLIYTFQPNPEPEAAQTVVRSEAIYNQIRRTWSPDQQHILYRPR